MKKPDIGAMVKQCERFNDRNKIGADVDVWPGLREGEPKRVKIIMPGAYVLRGHTAVVQVYLSHVREVARASHGADA